MNKEFAFLNKTMKILEIKEVKCFIIETDCLKKSGKTFYRQKYRRTNYQEGENSWEQYILGPGWEDCLDNEAKELEKLFLRSKIEFLK